MKILLAVDSSEASLMAAREVAARPWPRDSSIQILNVVDRPDACDIPEIEEGLRQAAQHSVQAAEAIVRPTGIETSTAVLFGDPKDVILRHAEATDAGLIVVGSHDDSAVTRLLLGSVARALVRWAPCSVEVVRAASGPGKIKVLLATDGSACSEEAARTVAERTWPSGAEFRILSVVELSAAWFRTPYPSYFDPKAMEQLRADAMKRAQEAVMSAELILTSDGLNVSGTVGVPTHSTRDAILGEAVEWGADLIVMGSHGRRGASRFLLGSVSEAVAFHANCSVEIIRGKQ